MTQVILGKSRVREICMPGSVRAKAEWLSYSTNSRLLRVDEDVADLDADPLWPEVMPRRRSCICIGFV